MFLVPEVLSLSGSEDSTSPLRALSHSDINCSSCMGWQQQHCQTATLASDKHSSPKFFDKHFVQNSILQELQL
jgi:hypothetical protein